MRLTATEVSTIKAAVTDVFGHDTRVLLFGSRVDDSKKGGDIDLFIEPAITEDLFGCKIRLLAQLMASLGEQKIDIVLASDPARLIEQEARKTGIEL